MLESFLKYFVSENGLRFIFYFLCLETTKQVEERQKQAADFKDLTKNKIKATNKKLFKRSKCTDETRMYDVELQEKISEGLKKTNNFKVVASHSKDTLSGETVQKKKDGGSNSNDQPEKFNNVWYAKTYNGTHYADNANTKTAIQNEILAGGLMSFLLYDLSIKYRRDIKDLEIFPISKEIKGDNIQYFKCIPLYKRQQIKYQKDINLQTANEHSQRVISKCFDKVAKMPDSLYQSLLTTQAYNYILGNVDGHLGNMRIVNGTDVLPFDFDRSFNDSSQINGSAVINQTLPLLIGLKMVLGEKYFKERIAEIIETFENRKVNFNKLLETNCGILSIGDKRKSEIKQNIENNLRHLQALAGMPLKAQEQTRTEQYTQSKNQSSCQQKSF